MSSSANFLSGFQGGLGTVMQLYDLKDRRRRAKREEEWQDKVRAQQEKQWAQTDADRTRKNDEQRLRDNLLIEDTLGSWLNGDPSKMTPGFYEATSRVYGDVLNQGYGKNKTLDRIVPTPDGKNWMAQLSVDDEKTGEKYQAPLTVNRSNDKNDQVRLFSPDDIAGWYAEAKRSTAHLPPEERKAILSKLREDVHMLAGDTSLRDTRIKREEADRLYKRERSDSAADRSADHANAKELQGMKNDAALERAQLEENGKSGSGYKLNQTQDDLTRMIFRDYEDGQGNFMGSSDSDLAERALRSAAATAWEQSNPGAVDYATTSRVSDQALEGIPFTKEQAEEMAPIVWEEFANSDMVAKRGRNRVLTVDGKSITEAEFKKKFVKDGPKNAEKAYLARFNELMNQEMMRRGSGQRQAQPMAQSPQANMTDADWLGQARQRQAPQNSSRQPIPIYDAQDRAQIANQQKQLDWGRSQLEQIEIPKTNEEINLIMAQGMQALRGGAPTQGVVDALRAQGIREDLINGLVSGTTGEKYQ